MACSHNLLMKTFFKLLFRVCVFLFFIALMVYTALPSPKFPGYLSDSMQNLEDADVETFLRRGYYTNFDRENVLDFYQNQMSSTFLGIPLLVYRLNYPPEEAFTWVRDQTRSTYLEEVVLPFRGSLFVNGFIPKLPKDDIWYKGSHFDQKVTVKYVPSPLLPRVIIMYLSLILLFIVGGKAINMFNNLFSDLARREK